MRRGDNARGDGANLCETVLEEIEVAFVTLMTYIDNHDFDLSIGPSHLETRTTLGAIIPSRARIRRTVQPGRNARHGGEGARAPIEVPPIEGG